MLITSRVRFVIQLTLKVLSHVLIQELGLTSYKNNKDILFFLESQLVAIRLKNTSLLLVLDWPGNAAIVALHEGAGGLFVWALTACWFINSYDPC